MRVWQLEAFGSLVLREQPRPEPGAHEILVRTQAVSLNYRDKAIIEGSYHDPVALPQVPASDMAGEVVAVGSAVTDFSVGDKVVSLFEPLWLDGPADAEAQKAKLGSPLPGVLSEYVLLSEQGALQYPKYLTSVQASTLPIAALTAWVGLSGQTALKPGKTVLIHGSGGVSLFGLQLAKAMGAEVIATSRSQEKAALLRQLGANHVIDTSEIPVWEQAVRSLTEGRGVDRVLEVIGGGSLQRSIAASATEGHIAVIGLMESHSAMIEIPSVIASQVTLRGVSVGSRRNMSDLLSFLETHPIQPVIDATYAFEAAPEAVAHLDRGPFGKVTIEV